MPSVSCGSETTHPQLLQRRSRALGRKKQRTSTTGQGVQPNNTPARTQTPDLKIDKDLEVRREGPEYD